MLIAKKPGKGIKICCNYWGINKTFLKNRYLLLFIKKILNAIYGAKLFTKLDIIAAFNKVRIVPNYK